MYEYEYLPENPRSDFFWALLTAAFIAGIGWLMNLLFQDPVSIADYWKADLLGVFFIWMGMTRSRIFKLRDEIKELRDEMEKMRDERDFA
jgi:hypothetical protein